MTARAVMTCERCGVTVSKPGLRPHQDSAACRSNAPLHVTPFQRACFAGMLAAIERAGRNVTAEEVARDGPPGYAGVKPGPIATALRCLDLAYGPGLAMGGPVVSGWEAATAPAIGLEMRYGPRRLDSLGRGAREWVTAEGFTERVERLGR